MPSAASFYLDTKQTGKPENGNIRKAETQPTTTSLFFYNNCQEGQ